MLEVKNLVKKFDNNTVLNGISFKVDKGDVVAIIGPSGCGKTTLLRCINMIEKPTSGDIYFENIKLNNPHTDLSKVRQKMGMVFQQFNLFPHLTVSDNITLAPIKHKKLSKTSANKRMMSLLKMINLSNKKDSYPSELSGGQMQRVAIARSLIMDPDIILFDEPTSALDPEMVDEVLNLIKMIADDGMTMLIVSHELDFVKKCANKFLFLEHGKVVFYGTLKELKNSENQRLKDFIN